MKIISMTAIAAVIALSVVAFGATGAAKAGPIVPPGHDCLEYAEGGTDCSFTSYARVRRPLRASPPNAVHLPFVMMSIGDGKAEASAHSGLPGPESLPLAAGRRPQFLRSSASQGRSSRICSSGQIISNRPPGPEWITRRKPCSFTIAATRFRPRPTPGVLRILSER